MPSVARWGVFNEGFIRCATTTAALCKSTHRQQDVEDCDIDDVSLFLGRELRMIRGYFAVLFLTVDLE
jgi:hypothetical protein